MNQEKVVLTTAELALLCDLTVTLTKLRLADTPWLCVENFAPDLLRQLIVLLKEEK